MQALKKHAKKHERKIRFGAIGIINTGLDFGILFVLHAIGLPVVAANFISTSIAFCFSFYANRKFAFKSNGKNIRREIALFLVVTLFGLWVLQPIVIGVVTNILRPTGINESALLLIGKLAATVVSLTWNYILYARVVFKQS